MDVCFIVVLIVVLKTNILTGLLCRSLCSLLREILAGSVLLPAMDVLADPVSLQLLTCLS